MKPMKGELRWALVGLCALSAMGCASRQAEPVSTTATHGAYLPGEVELYIAREVRQDVCRVDLPPNVDFAAGTAELIPGEVQALDAWAHCVNRPEVAHTTIVLLGGEGEQDPEGLFAQRAAVVRTLLVQRRVDPERIVIGAPNRTRAGTHGARDVVRLETTHAQTLRAMALRSQAGAR
jgi:hypothetical protein